MNEIESICRCAAQLAARAQPGFLASVVRVRGSAYRRAGARLLFTREAALAGSVSAGCIESELVRSGSFHAAESPVLRSFEAGAADADEPQQGSGCGGTIEVLLEPCVQGCADALAFIARALAQQQRVGMATVIQTRSPLCRLGARVVCAGSQTLSFGFGLGLEGEIEALAREALEPGMPRVHCVRRGALELLLEVLEPSPRLFVFGAQPDAVPLVNFASELGWEVSVVSRHDRPALRERFAATRCRYVVGPAGAVVPRIERCVHALAVVMSHDYANDRETLAALLGAKLDYLGVLGPLNRTQRLLADLESSGVNSVGALSRIHAPVGLKIGAQTPAEIALAIVAEAQACLRATDTSSLREQAAPARDCKLALAEAAE